MSNNEKNKTKHISILNMVSSALYDMAELPKKMLKYATPAAFCLVILGTAFFIANKMSINYSSVFEFTSTTLIKNSVFLLAEFVIASFVIDILTKKKAQ